MIATPMNGNNILMYLGFKQLLIIFHLLLSIVPAVITVCYFLWATARVEALCASQGRLAPRGKNILILLGAWVGPTVGVLWLLILYESIEFSGFTFLSAVIATYFVPLFIGSHVWGLLGSACIAVILTIVFFSFPLAYFLRELSYMGMWISETGELLTPLFWTNVIVVCLCGVVYLLAYMIPPR
jgi:hypothetical protein